jgi:hypothetical protein
VIDHDTRIEKESRCSVIMCLLSTGLCTTVIALLTPGSVALDFVHFPAHTEIEWNEVPDLTPKLAVWDTVPDSMDVSYPTTHGRDAGSVLPPSIHRSRRTDIHLAPDEIMTTHAIRNDAFSLPLNLFSYWACWACDIGYTMERRY